MSMPADYMSDPQNKTYMIVLSVAIVVLVIAVAIIVFAYKRKKRQSEEIENAPIIDEKPIPENLVDEKTLKECEKKISESESSASPESESAKTADRKPEVTLTAKSTLPVGAFRTDNATKSSGAESSATDEKLTDKPAEKIEEKPTAKIAEKSADKSAEKPAKKAENEAKNRETERKQSERRNERKTEQKPADDEAESAARKYSGKWVIVTEPDGRMTAYLKASNGEKMLATESYSSLSGIKSGIDTLKKNIENDNYAINLDKNGNFVFKIFSGANRLLCVGEGYSSREQCEKAFASVKRFSKTAVIVVEKDGE